MKKDVAVIILNWNSAPLLRRYLPGVLQNTNPDMADVIVADNGSTDASRQVLEEEFPQVPTILLDKNYGYAEGYNKSIAQAAGYKYTVLLNSDVRTPQGWLEPLYRYMDEHPQVGAVQPKVLQDRDDGRQVFDYAGAAGGYLDKHGYPYCRGRLFSTIEDDHGQYDSAQGADVFWASGACLMVRTALYREVGGLDSAFFAHMEEIDLCWRLGCRGRRLMCVPQSYVFHVGGATLSKTNPKKTYLNFRNNLLMIYKNAPAARLHSILRFRALADTAAALMFLLTGHTRDAAAVMRARRDFRRMRRTFLPEREVNMRQAVTLTPPCVYRRSILYSYYIRGRHHFSQLKMPSL